MATAPWVPLIVRIAVGGKTWSIIRQSEAQRQPEPSISLGQDTALVCRRFWCPPYPSDSPEVRCDLKSASCRRTMDSFRLEDRSRPATRSNLMSSGASPYSPLPEALTAEYTALGPFRRGAISQHGYCAILLQDEEARSSGSSTDVAIVLQHVPRQYAGGHRHSHGRKDGPGLNGRGWGRHRARKKFLSSCVGHLWWSI